MPAQKKGETQMQKSNKKTIIKPVGALSVRNIHEKDPIAPSKNHRGITLIALIITIIVMIILVGVTINIALNGGLFETTEKAAKGTQIEADREILQVGVAGALVSEEGITKESLQNNLPEEWNVNGEGPFTVISPNGNKFTVNLDGTIETNNEEDTEIPEVEKVMDEYPGDITDNGTRDGTESNPYMINSMEDLVAFGELVDMGETYEGKIVKLGYNLDFKSNNSYINPNEPYTSKEKGEQIDINENGTIESIKTEVTTGRGFNGIGKVVGASSSGPITGQTSFKGTFEGNGKIISNFYQNLMIVAEEGVNDIGIIFSTSLFASNEGTIRNLGIKLAKNSILYSGFVGINGNYVMMDDLEETNSSASIENCFCTVLEGSFSVPGLIAINVGTVENSYTSGKISLSRVEEIGLGGIGICNESYGGTIKNCYSLILDEDGNKISLPLIISVNDSTNTKKATIENCYNPSGTIVGSIRGGSIVDIRNCYSTGNLTNVKGGIVGTTGDRYSNLTTITLDNCYFKGRIDYSTSYNPPVIDGLVGNKTDKTTITNSKYLEKSLYVNGELQPDDENAATEEEMNTYMKSVLEVVNGDGAFKEDTNNINNGYPILSWQ